MKPRRFILDPANAHVGAVRDRAARAVMDLEEELSDRLEQLKKKGLKAKPIQITICDYDPPRTLDQNDFYWAAAVSPLAEYLGYTRPEMHEVLLAEFFGTKEIGKLVIPRRRSKELTKTEMREYLDWVPRFAAEQGVVLGV